MNRIFVIAILQLCIRCIVYGQAYTLTGQILDASSHESVPYASIYLDSVFLSSVSDDSGYYNFDKIQPGVYNLCISHLGYQKTCRQIIITDNPVISDFELSPLADTLSPIVVTGTGTPYRLEDVPVQTEIITSNTLQKISGRGIEDIISNIDPSLDFTSSSMGTSIKINGLGEDYVLILINGKRLTGKIGGYYDLSRIDPEDVEQIEIIKGAASTLYGSDAIGGVINIITKKSQNIIKAVNNTRVGAYGDLRQFNSLSFQKKKFSSKTSFNYKKTDGWQLSDMEYNSKWESNHDLPYLVTTYDMPVNKNWAYTISQNINFNPTKKISLYTDFSWYEKTLYFPFKGNNYNYYYNDINAAVGGSYKLKNKNYIDFSISFGDFNYYTEYPNKYNVTYYTADDVVKVTYYPGDRFKNSEQINLISQIKGVFKIKEKNILSVGTETYTDNLESKYRLTKDQVMATTWAFYVQDEFKLSEKIDFVGGVRLNYHDKFGFMATPKLSAMYKLTPFTFRFNYASGYKSPTLKELYYYYESNRMGTYRLYLGNEDLKPETSQYFSFSSEYKFKTFKTSLTTYLNRIYNMIDYEIIETSWDNERRGIEETKMRYNIADARNIGVDWLFNINLYKQLSFTGGYSYVDARNITQNIRLNGVSEHSARFKTSWKKSWDKYLLNLTLSGEYKSDKFYLEDEDEQSYADPYQLWVLTSTHKFKYIHCCNLTLTAGVDNIFNYVDDRPYGSHYGTLNPGRTFFIGINIDFEKVKTINN